MQIALRSIRRFACSGTTCVPSQKIYGVPRVSGFLILNVTFSHKRTASSPWILIKESLAALQFGIRYENNIDDSRRWLVEFSSEPFHRVILDVTGGVTPFKGSPKPKGQKPFLGFIRGRVPYNGGLLLHAGCSSSLFEVMRWGGKEVQALEGVCIH